MAVRHFRHQVGGRGRDDDKVRLAREADMADVEFGDGVEQVCIDVPARQRAGRERRDEFLRRVGHDDAHARAALFQAADEIEGFIGRDAAADDEQHAALCGVVRDRLSHIRRCGGLILLRRRTASRNSGRGRIPGACQDEADFLLHGPAITGRADPELLLQVISQVTNGQ